MKKIKSVKLLKDLPGYSKGTYLVELEIGLWSFHEHNNAKYSIQFIKNNPDFFEIEYEPERKYVDVRIEVPCTFEFIPNISESIERKLRIELMLNAKVTKLGEGTL